MAPGRGRPVRAAALALLALVAGSCTPDPPPPGTVLATWATRSPSPEQRYEANGTAVGDRLYVLGGFVTTSIHASTSAAAYEP
ncbi:MAG: hypothetical protein K0R11_1270, partial [Acidimicrobiales bacterium]|nr:hypothetical protein [Acidimicrobiales bacterium]